MVDFTAHFRFGIPNFDQDPWHEDFETLAHAIDTAIYQAIVANDVEFWQNSTAYTIGKLVIDQLTGIMYTAGQDHTSPASPTTFAADRLANPGRWNATANIPQQKGTWTTATQYIPGDFVVDTNRYAVCLQGHVSGVFNTDLAAGKWSILIDLSALGVGINAEAEGTIASGATTNIGGQSPTRLFVTGNTTITSFGVVANTYKILRFQQALNITPGANLILTGGASPRVTDAGGIMIVASDNTGKWYELVYTPGTAPAPLPDASTTVKGIVELATTAETQGLADAVRAVTPAGLAGALTDLSASIINTLRNGVSATLDTFAEVASALSLLAPQANPTFTGVVTIPTPALNDDSTKAASTAYVIDEIADKTQAADGTSLVLIRTETFAAASVVTFLHGTNGVVLDDTYDRYVLEICDLTVGTNQTGLRMEVATSGPTWQGASYRWSNNVMADSTFAGATNSSDSFINLSRSNLGNDSGNIGNDTGEDADMTITFCNPDAGRRLKFKWDGVYSEAANVRSIWISGHGGWNPLAASLAPIIGIRIAPSQGTFSGRMSLYGLKKS